MPIETTLSIQIAAPPERVVALYLDVAHWHELFPATIRAARIVRSSPEEVEIEVDHLEGKVPNFLRQKSPTEIELDEHKRLFRATFSNRFEPHEGGTRYTLVAHVQLIGWARLLTPFVGPVVRSRMRRFVLEPMKAAAERPTNGDATGPCVSR
ncbi:MAG: SRPBCC family protein [Myxococcaceae bacterium]|nr:SRPBCC family protein [Myxococcaceae bacterium]